MSRIVHAAIAAALAAACLSFSNGTLAADKAAAATPSPGAKPPISDFVKPTDFSQVSISPDGKYIAALVPKVDDPHENTLVVMDGKTARLLQAIPAGNRALVASYFWGEDDRLIASLAIRWDGLDTPGRTGELFAIDPDATHQIALFGWRAGGAYSSTGQVGGPERRHAAAEPIDENYVGKDQILIAVWDFARVSSGSYTSIERLNVRTGKTSQLGLSPTHNASMVADHAGQVRVATSDNDYTGTHLWLRKNNDSPWVLVNEPAKSHVEIKPIGFNRDNTKLYVQVSEGSHPDTIQLLDMESQQRTVLYEGKFADPGAMLPTADHKDYYAVITMDDRPGLHFFDEDSDEALLSQAIAKSFPGQFAYISNVTRDGKRAIVHVSSDRNPGDYYLFDLATRNAQLLVHARPWVDPNVARPMEPVQITARDGITMHGFLTTPAGPKPYPLVVLPHGGPHGIFDYWGYEPEVQMLASRGYAVLQVNYRGSGGYGIQFEKIGYKQWGLSMQDDLTDATRWAVTQGYTDAQHICIYGGSYGGYAALEGAAREPDLYKCAVGYAGVYDLRVQVDRSDTHRSDMGMSYLDTVLGTDRDDLLRRSPLGGVKQIKANILLMHGGEDPRVPIKNFDEFTQALRDNGKQYETLVEPKEGHGFFVPAHREAAYQKLLDFLDRNIGTANAQATSSTSAASDAVKGGVN